MGHSEKPDLTPRSAHGHYNPDHCHFSSFLSHHIPSSKFCSKVFGNQPAALMQSSKSGLCLFRLLLFIYFHLYLVGLLVFLANVCKSANPALVVCNPHIFWFATGSVSTRVSILQSHCLTGTDQYLGWKACHFFVLILTRILKVVSTNIFVEIRACKLHIPLIIASVL